MNDLCSFQLGFDDSLESHLLDTDPDILSLLRDFEPINPIQDFDSQTENISDFPEIMIDNSMTDLNISVPMCVCESSVNFIFFFLVS